MKQRQSSADLRVGEAAEPELGATFAWREPVLFSVKNRLVPTLLLLAAFVAAAFLARAALGLTWRLQPHPGLGAQGLLGLAALLAADGLLHGALRLAWGDRYLARYQALVAYFRPQGPIEIAAGGLLAGGEELIFRGVLLQSLMSRAGLAPVPAIAISALAFGALHTVRDPRLAPFALWAAWQGIILGGIYVATGSLLLLVLMHTAHDIVGFSLFAWQRRTGWLLEGKRHPPQNLQPPHP